MSHQETILLEQPSHVPASGNPEISPAPPQLAHPARTNPETPPTSSQLAQHAAFDYQERSNMHEVVSL